MKAVGSEVYRRDDFVGGGSASAHGHMSRRDWRLAARLRRMPMAGVVGRESDAERRPTSAGGLRARIANDELRAIEVVAKINLGAAQVLEAHRIDQQLHALLLDAGIPVLDLLVELKAVLQTRAAPALHEHAQHELGIALTGNQLADLAGRGIGKQQRRLAGLG